MTKNIQQSLPLTHLISANVTIQARSTSGIQQLNYLRYIYTTEKKKLVIPCGVGWVGGGGGGR